MNRCLFPVIGLTAIGLFASAPRVQAESAPMLVDFSFALQALDKTFDPREDQQWDNMSKFLSSPDLKWIVEYSFNKERTRSIYVYLYSQCVRLRSHAADMLQLIDAGRAQDVSGLSVLVTPNVFAELQRTLKTPKDVSVLFRTGKGTRGASLILVSYNAR